MRVLFVLWLFVHVGWVRSGFLFVVGCAVQWLVGVCGVFSSCLLEV